MPTWEHFARFLPCDIMSKLYVAVSGGTNIFIIFVHFGTGSAFEPGRTRPSTFGPWFANKAELEPTFVNFAD